MTGSLTWPADFPADCPPGQAVNAEGTYYRIVKHDPPEQSDFEAIYHTDPIRAEDAMSHGKTTCETMGLSVYADIDHAIQCASRFRKLGRNIARLTLMHEAGKALRTRGTFSSHHTWWKPVGFDPIQHSRVVFSV
jgi:hypothetical protein